MKAIQTGTKFQICDESIQTYDQLPAFTYAVGFNQNEGCYLIKRSNIAVNEKTYGVHNKKIEKVMNSYKQIDRSLGVILSGDKGIGKSMFAKLLCIRAVEEGIPVIIVDACVPGIARFIESITQNCVVLFDEFDKTFRNSKDDNEQAKLLSLFDGTAGGKKLFIVTCNELWGLNDYIVNRPGRFHYHFRFEYPTPADITDYLKDKLNPVYYGEIEHVVAFSQKISLNYDCLRSIAFELNQGSPFAEAVADLNILNTEKEEYNVILYFENGETLHQWRYRTNLFDSDGTWTWITMYNSAGREVLDVKFDKHFIMYDVTKGTTVIPAEGLELDFSDYDDEKQSEPYKNMQVRYMSFTKCNAKNLHYAV